MTDTLLMAVRHRLGALCVLVTLVGVGCAGSSGPTLGQPPRHSAITGVAKAERADIVRTARAMIGHPYRYGGASPAGFDCSGLVLYSYGEAGVGGLPHSAKELERRARPVAIADLEPGDLLFFHLTGKKASHVAIYVGNRAFVHAPSSGKRVEQVSFDHVYWGERVRLAGRLLP